MTTATRNQATKNQLSKIRELLQERAGHERAQEIRTAMNEFRENGELYPYDVVSGFIGELYALPRTDRETQAPAAPNVEPGVYVLPGESIVKVQENKAKTSVYASRWHEINGERLLDFDGQTRVRGEWEYVAGLIRSVKPEHRMSLEQAKAFVLRYGQCARCGRKLKAAESVERGIGPVCAKWFRF